ncbi:MAG TPA: D-alanyl-D-alanine carboxypeptidase [Streptomyces sp.]|nr:D-alanyl-D-alanine carboxypeptidase [Streptomyces sp.]
MTVGLVTRTVVSACALCATGLLALTPAAASRTGAPHPTAGPDSRRDATRQPTSLLHRPGTQVRPDADAPPVPRLSALSWLVADAGSGAVLAAHDAHRGLPPASTLKTLFALTVLPVLPGGIRHTVEEEELRGIGEGSSLVGVAEGVTYRVADLWHGVFLSSGNDAVHVLARLSGGRRSTAARMQAEARALGALDTHVVSPDGYDAPGQVSSAFDLAVFGREGLRNPDFARYCAVVRVTFPGGRQGPYPIQNTNRLLTGADGVARYPGLIGIKNGYTTKAGHTLVAAAERAGRTLVVTVLHPRSGGPWAVYEEARRLLDWGFAASGRVEPVGSLEARRPAPRPGPPAATPAALPGGRTTGVPWWRAGAIAGAAALGAAVTALFLRGTVPPPEETSA